ncbi:hypothetical protein G7Y89_g11287 [Cudoniella acicularis]|uniref:Meiotic recombination protein DMC1 n=1 Tax=Cudoniella acicularis TaxID=354080 RepID=A0A8H4RDE3_9HELO|nr:hypothetical protein G7Y89_g11287 [Cudoniella acicularis]
MDASTNEPGGFFRPSLPSPAPSNASTSSTSSNLPHPRAHPLRAGSAKEDAARRYVEGRLMHISRRYTKKFQPHQEGEEVHGYVSMSDVSRDLGEVVDVLWLSGTRTSSKSIYQTKSILTKFLASLQIPYLLNVALSITTYLPAFPPSPSATFRLLKKLDHVFSSLLKGEDIISRETLPGFENGKKAGMSKTDMVRCKSLVESTRVIVVDVMSKDPEPDSGDPEESGVETDSGVDFDGIDDEDDRHEMDVARVYEKTIIQLGELLDSGTGFSAGSGEN